MLIETLDIGSIWLIRRFTDDKAEDENTFTLIIIESKGIDFKSIKLINNHSKGVASTYNDTKIKDNNIFYGEIRKGTNGWLPIINIKQYNETSNYYAFYIGRETIAGTLAKYEAEWVDNSGKNGKFEFEFKSNSQTS